MTSKRNVKCLTIKEKLKLIAEVEKGEKKKKDIAQQFEIPPNTLSTILKNKNKLLDKEGDYNFNSKRKRFTACLNNDIDEAMLKWVTTARDKNLPLSGTLIREKAKEFAVALGREDFSASVGWLDKFKKRHNIAQMSICGESASADFQSAEDWKKKVLPDLIRHYHENDIFNADETGLFFKCLPNKTLAFKGQKCFGGKNSKERITVMVASNMSGSEKLKLLVIGKSKNPRCSKGIKLIDVDYEFNKKAWMTSEIYDKWLKKLDKIFVAQNRKILMFVDNCPGHPKNVQANLKNIKLEYFPPNLTSVLQPMDQGIIQNLKQHYRKRIVMKVLANMEESTPTTVSLLDAIRDLNKTWNLDVKQQTISNCFRKAGFAKDKLMQNATTSDWDEEDDLPLSELKQIWTTYRTAMGSDNVSFDDYVDIDDGVQTMGFPTDEDILDSVIENLGPSVIDLEEEVSSESEIETTTETIPTFNQAYSAIQTLRNFTSSKENVPNTVHTSLNVVENFIEKDKWSALKQKK